jgi:hypothetical protein
MKRVLVLLLLSTISLGLACGPGDRHSTTLAAAEETTPDVRPNLAARSEIRQDQVRLDRYLRKHHAEDLERRAAQKRSEARRRAQKAPRASRAGTAPRGSGTPTLAQLDALAMCESGMNPNTNTGNGFVNAFQYMKSTWNNLVRKIGRADLVGNYFPPYEVQRWVTQHINLSAWGSQFPACSRKLRSKGII